MSIEDRKIYNEKYYTENKKSIKEKLLVKVECPLCHKHISKANLERAGYMGTKLVVFSCCEE